MTHQDLEQHGPSLKWKSVALILPLVDSNIVIRTKAREEWIEISSPDVTQGLVLELNDHPRTVWWEFAKGPISIADPLDL